MRSITLTCSGCKKPTQIPIENEGDICCNLCSHHLGQIDNYNNLFERCPLCTGRQFYIQKDFNRGLGCFIVLIGIMLVPATYGMSLPIVALIDWLMYKKVAHMVICYRCGAEYRGFTYPERFKPYMHHIGLKYDKFR